MHISGSFPKCSPLFPIVPHCSPLFSMHSPLFSIVPHCSPNILHCSLMSLQCPCNVPAIFPQCFPCSPNILPCSSNILPCSSNVPHCPPNIPNFSQAFPIILQTSCNVPKVFSRMFLTSDSLRYLEPLGGI